MVLEVLEMLGVLECVIEYIEIQPTLFHHASLSDPSLPRVRRA